MQIGLTDQPGPDEAMVATQRRLVSEVYSQVKSPASWGTFVESIQLSMQSERLTCHIRLQTIQSVGHIRWEALLKEQ